MKTKSQKKGKKQLSREISPPSKSGQKSKNIIESKKKRKKAKIDNTVQNGDPMLQVNVKAFEKINKNKQKKKQKKRKEQNNDNIEMLSKAKMKTNIVKETESTIIESKTKIIDEKKERKLGHLKNKQLIREMNKSMLKGRYHRPLQDHIKAFPDLDKMKKQLTDIKSRKELSKTARRRMAVLLKKIAVAEAENKFKKLNIVEEDNDKNQHQVNKSSKNKKKTKVKDRKKAKREHRRDKKANIEIEQNDQNDNDEDNENQSDKDESDEDMEKENEKAMDFGQTEVDAESVEDDSDQRDDEETAIVEVKKKKGITYVDESSDVPIKKNKKKKRYVLFVGNLPHDITMNQLKQHFLTKVDTVTNIRIQTNQNTKTSPGSAYVEVSNSTDYEKGLSLNHTFLKKKRINVQFTAPKNTKKVNIVAKNKKLEVLRKAEKLANVREKKKLLKKGKQKFAGLKA